MNVVRACRICGGRIVLLLMSAFNFSKSTGTGEVEVNSVAPVAPPGAAMSIRAKAKFRAGMYDGRFFPPAL